MDNKTWLGALSELKVATKFTEHRFDVFTQASGKAPFDLVVHKDGLIARVSVKGTTNIKYGSWNIQIGSIRSNRTENIIYKFDPLSCDILACYIQPIDTVCFLLAKDITAGRLLSLREEPTTKSKVNLLVSDHMDPDRVFGELAER